MLIWCIVFRYDSALLVLEAQLLHFVDVLVRPEALQIHRLFVFLLRLVHVLLLVLWQRVERLQLFFLSVILLFLYPIFLRKLLRWDNTIFLFGLVAIYHYRYRRYFCLFQLPLNKNVVLSGLQSLSKLVLYLCQTPVLIFQLFCRREPLNRVQIVRANLLYDLLLSESWLNSGLPVVWHYVVVVNVVVGFAWLGLRRLLVRGNSAVLLRNGRFLGNIIRVKRLITRQDWLIAHWYGLCLISLKTTYFALQTTLRLRIKRTFLFLNGFQTTKQRWTLPVWFWNFVIAPYLFHRVENALRAFIGRSVIKVMLALYYGTRLVHFAAVPNVVEDLEHNRLLFRVETTTKIIRDSSDLALFGLPSFRVNAAE